MYFTTDMDCKHEDKIPRYQDTQILSRCICIRAKKFHAIAVQKVKAEQIDRQTQLTLLH